MTFDASKEAVKIEHMAKERIDTDVFDKTKSSDALAKEWLGLSSSQRTEVGKILEQKYDNNDWNTLPRPHIEKNAKGEVTGIDFAASKLDFGSEVKDFRMRALSPETGGQFVEVASNQGNDSKGFQWLDGLAFDSNKTENNLTREALTKIGALPYDKRDYAGPGVAGPGGAAPGGDAPRGAGAVAPPPESHNYPPAAGVDRSPPASVPARSNGTGKYDEIPNHPQINDG